MQRGLHRQEVAHSTAEPCRDLNGLAQLFHESGVRGIQRLLAGNAVTLAHEGLRFQGGAEQQGQEKQR